MAPTVEKSKKADKADKADKKARKEEKKARKEQKVIDSGITKTKKDKKEKKSKHSEEALLAELSKDESAPAKVKAIANGEGAVSSTDLLSPFALPLANESQEEAIFELVNLASKLGAVARGVKECKKLIKKSPMATEIGKGQQSKDLLTIIAADVAPFQVVEAIPFMCEEHGISTFFARHRSQLGSAAATQRATAVAVLKREPKASKLAEAKEKPEFKALLKEYHSKLDKVMGQAQTEYVRQVLPWAQGVAPAQVAAISKRATV